MEVLLCNRQQFKTLNMMICFPCSPRCKSILRLLNYHVSWSKPTANGSGLYDSCVSQTVGGRLAPRAPISCLQWSPWNFVPGCNFDLAHGGSAGQVEGGESLEVPTAWPSKGWPACRKRFWAKCIASLTFAKCKGAKVQSPCFMLSLIPRFSWMV